jgi:hypothetical protein
MDMEHHTEPRPIKKNIYNVWLGTIKAADAPHSEKALKGGTEDALIVAVSSVNSMFSPTNLRATLGDTAYQPAYGSLG